jgi:hypothetical protein
MRSGKNLFIFTTGLLACLLGTYISLREIINKFSTQD